MYYWNQHNFEGLLQLAHALETNDHLKPLAAYCRFRELGLRRDALLALEQYLEEARAFDSATARLAAVHILEAHARTQGVTQFLTQPLVARFLQPTLRAWMQDDANTNVPVRWLGMLDSDRALLARAVAMCPDDTPARKRLIDLLLGDVEYATHHLDESAFIGSVEAAASALELAGTLVASAAEPDAFARHASDVRYFTGLIADWRAYSENRRGAFPEWCALHGRNYTYAVKVYYER
ncbi:hypothetical protein [Burkholderia sp. Ac-20379]|uniref:hypothetical protein n=1 Tax=Burkholderia sp. Ac-20379 TaxID=2703900 RepID=UPI0019800460|nr:hypothetical protein [Burkholderia sp. Ac-20379]MBN3727952.1 hypothetical protein [Burkholderia sp. Ac-20379]